MVYLASCPSSGSDVLCNFGDRVSSRHSAIRADGSLANRLLDGKPAERTISLHAFVFMPSHFQALITPGRQVPMEKAMQFIKGGFSYRARRELNVNFAIWQGGFTNHRIEDWRDYEQHRSYIHQNPVKARLVDAAEVFPYSSAFPGIEMDPAPPWLKPLSSEALSRGA